MCELFSMSSNVPENVTFSLEEFSRHGGLTGPHKDGWGIAYYAQGDVRLLKEPLPAHDSACLRFIQDHPFTSALVMSHIRKATQGAHTFVNCQPYMRELGGAMHVFAHNGHLDPARLRARLPLGFHRPIGDTDSEYAFCALLARLQDLWLDANGVPPLAARRNIVTAFAAELRALGLANFLYADGDALFAHGHKRPQEDEGIRPPGLHVLCRRCAHDASAATLNMEGLEIQPRTGGEQEVVLVASVPLTEESDWRALAEGEVIAVREGAIQQ
jgi:predicted glutamine amidotransferase